MRDSFDHGTAWAMAAICLGGLLLLQAVRGDPPHPAIPFVPAAVTSGERLDRHEFEERVGETTEAADDGAYLFDDCLM